MRAIALLLCVGACSEGGSSMSSGCELSLSLTGAVTATFDASSMLGCDGAVDLGGEPILVFFPDHPSIMRLDLELAETGGPGDFAIISPSGFVWEARDCTYTVVRWQDTGGEIRAAGSATCPPAEPEAGSGAVAVGTFTFDML